MNLRECWFNCAWAGCGCWTCFVLLPYGASHISLQRAVNATGFEYWMSQTAHRVLVCSRFVVQIFKSHRANFPGSHWLCPSSSVSYASTVPRRRPILIVVKWHSHWDSQTLRRQRCGRTSNMWRQRWFSNRIPCTFTVGWNETWSIPARMLNFRRTSSTS